MNINSTASFDRIVATSSSYAFEFDNVAFSPNGGSRAILDRLGTDRRVRRVQLSVNTAERLGRRAKQLSRSSRCMCVVQSAPAIVEFFYGRRCVFFRGAELYTD